MPHLCYSESKAILLETFNKYLALQNVIPRKAKGNGLCYWRNCTGCSESWWCLSATWQGTVTSVWLQDRREGGHRLLGGMSILFLPQTQLAQNTIPPCAESSSSNNMDRKCWSVQKKSSRSHKIKNGWRQRRA